MKIKLEPANPKTWPKGRINAARLDAQTEADLAVQQASDDGSARRATTNAASGHRRETPNHLKAKSNFSKDDDAGSVLPLPANP